MQRLKRSVVPVLLFVAVYYAVFRGEYSVFDLRDARAAAASAEAELTEVRHQIDSLRARADSLESDPATLERIARERFGMIREGETLYRFVPDSTSADREREPAR